MGTPIFRSVRQLVRGILLDNLGDTLLSDRIAWENKQFSPPTPNPGQADNDPYWIRETCQPAYERQYIGELLEMVGITTFDVFYPIGWGTERPEDIVQQIADAYEKTASASSNGISVGIEKVTKQSGLQIDSAWWMASVSIYWRTYSVATSIIAKL